MLQSNRDVRKYVALEATQTIHLSDCKFIIGDYISRGEDTTNILTSK